MMATANLLDDQTPFAERFDAHVEANCMKTLRQLPLGD
jgi:hypothetical protein